MMQDLICVKVVHLSASIKIKMQLWISLASSSCIRVWYFGVQKMSVQIKREYRLAFVCYQSMQNMVLQMATGVSEEECGNAFVWAGVQRRGGGGTSISQPSDRIDPTKVQVGVGGIKEMLQEARVLLHHWHMGPSAGLWLSIIILTQRNCETERCSNSNEKYFFSGKWN